MNELTEKWEKTGLLAELDDFNKDECAASLEKAADLLVGEMVDYVKEVDKMSYEGYFATNILPIVRRLYGGREFPVEKAPSVDLKWLFEDFGNYAKNNYHKYRNMDLNTKLDCEIELVVDYIDGLKNRL